ncbi:MAG: tetratricopeptide repeat protein [Myxococcota bacterium]
MVWLIGWLAVPCAAGAEPDPAADARARELFLEGDAHYAAGRYEEAEKRFLEAYELSGRPVLLFNLANVYERLSDYEAAADCLRRYLDGPEVHDIVSVQERLRRLELAAEQAEAPEAPREPSRQERRAQARAERADRPPRDPLPAWPTWALGGATAAAGITTVTLGALTLQTRSDVRSRCPEGSDGVSVCAESAQPFLEREQNRARATDIALGTTAALGAATLTYVLIRGLRGEGREAPLTLVPVVGRDGAGLSLVVAGRMSPRAVAP